MAGERKPGRPADKIVRGLKEFTQWSNGKGTLLVCSPGHEPRLMTRDEFETARVDTPAPSQTRGEVQR